jgi:hypothetical protein
MKTPELKKYIFFRYFYIVLLTYCTNILWMIHSFGELLQPPGHKFQQLSIFNVSPTKKRGNWSKKGANATFLGV